MSKIIFDSVYNPDNLVYTRNQYILYDLLKERDLRYGISHKEMPIFSDHVRFVNSRPYKRWHLIYDAYLSVQTFCLGSIYTTHNNELGIFLFKKCQSMGYGTEILKLYLKEFPEEFYLANIHPDNFASVSFFKKFNFVKILELHTVKVLELHTEDKHQETYRLSFGS